MLLEPVNLICVVVWVGGLTSAGTARRERTRRQGTTRTQTRRRRWLAAGWPQVLTYVPPEISNTYWLLVELSCTVRVSSL